MSRPVRRSVTQVLRAPSLDLTIETPGTVAWIPGGGISVTGEADIISDSAASAISSAVKASGEITMEAWVKPDQTFIPGTLLPHRLVSMELNHTNTNFTLGQDNDSYEGRLRTTTVGPDGIPELLTGLPTSSLQHVVYTFTEGGTDNAKMYVNGTLAGSATIGGNVSNWDDSYFLYLANAAAGARTFLGDFCLVAVYGSALDATQVAQNHSEGCSIDLDAAATVEITPGSGIGASTFSADSFQITNTGNVAIDDVTIDLSTAFFPDVIFDPVGEAGDATSGCLVPNGASDNVGYVTPANNCVDPFAPGGGSPTTGYPTATVAFTGFDPGEEFIFTADVDPYSIKGFDSAGNAGAISGLELSGATVTIGFSNGDVVTQVMADGSQGGSTTSVPVPVTDVITLDVPAAPLAATSFSNGAQGAFVSAAAQTATVSGPQGTAVTLIVVDANLEDEPVGGYNEVDLFERNMAQSVTYLNATIGAGGTVDVPFTVSTTPGETTYLIAAADSVSGSGVGIAGPVTAPVYLEYAPSASPIIDPIGNVTVFEGETVSVDISAIDPDADGPLALTIATSPTNAALEAGFADNGGGDADLVWNTVTGNAGVTTVTITADDSDDPTTDEVFTVTVLEPGDFAASSTFEILAGNNSIGSSTFGGGSFEITNTSASAATISQVVLDLRTAQFPDMVFDPDGDAGDATAKCFEPDLTEASAVGLTTPPGGGAPCDNTALSVPHLDGPGNPGNGFDVITLDATDWDFAETLSFSIDNDPTSIQGVAGAGDSGSVSGFELIGATVTVTYELGGEFVVQTGRLVHQPGGGGNNVLDGAGVLALPNGGTGPSIDIAALTLNPTVFPNAATAAQTDLTSHTVTVTGTPNEDVTIVVTEGTNNQAAPFDPDPFEANKAQVITSYTATLNGAGTADVLVNLPDAAVDDFGDFYYIYAIEDGSSITDPSNFIYLEQVDELATSEATLGINPGATALETASTFSPGSFVFENTGETDILGLTIDLSTAFLPDVIFDPSGEAGDITASCFGPTAGAAAVGLVVPSNLCTDPYSGGTNADGYTTLSLAFTDFNPGETFTFTADVDPHSIAGYGGAGNAGAISGLEVTGATVSVTFSDGGQVSQTFGDGSVGGSFSTIPSPVTVTPTLDIAGVTLDPSSFSNGAETATVPDAAQVATVTGPIGADVTLIVIDADLEDAPAGGFNDLDPFERNKAMSVTYLTDTVGAGGTVDIPFSVTTNADWSTYVIATVENVDGVTGPVTRPVYLEVGDVTPPPATTTVLYRVNAGGPQVAAGDGSTPPWSEDQSLANANGTAATGTPSPFVNFADTDITYGQTPTITFDASVPAAAQVQALFQTERYDVDDATSPVNMIWNFDASAGNTYVVNLYFAEIFDGANIVGLRQMDVYIEDELVLDDYDAFADVGEDTGVMKSFIVDLADDFITIEFDHVAQNPAIKAIEILVAAENATGTVPSGGVLTTDTELDGATDSDVLETTITMPSAGGPFDGAITEGPPASAPPLGVGYVAEEADITVTPNAPSAADPFEILFELDDTVVPAEALTVYKDGVPVPACTGAPSAIPDPCEVLPRATLGNGNLQITVLTTSASTWSFGIAPPVDLVATPATIDFADAPTGGPTFQDITFTHTGAPGSAAIEILATDITIGGDAELTLSAQPSTTTTLNAGDSFDVTVQYLPTALTSNTATVTVVHDGDNSPVTVPVTANAVAGPQPGDVLYRVNAGGPTIPAKPSDPNQVDWVADSSSGFLTDPSPQTSTQATASALGDPDNNVPTYVPGGEASDPMTATTSVFHDERYDSGTPPAMTYSFPVDAGQQAVVNVFLRNGCPCTQANGARIFDLTVEGTTVSSIDLSADYGHLVPRMVTFDVIAGPDGDIDVSFGKITENPLVNAIEVLQGGPQPDTLGVSPGSLDFGPIVIAGGSVQQFITLTNLGDTGDDPIAITDIQKATGGVEYSLTSVPSLPLNLQPGVSVQIEVSYDPVDSGFDSASVEITHGASNGPISTVTIDGEGVSNLPVAFGASGLSGEVSNGPTSLDFGPDGRLYVAQKSGNIYAYTITRNAANDYSVDQIESIDKILDIQNHNDDGAENNTRNRLITGLMTAGTAEFPELYVTSSDWRIAVGNDTGLDTNSGVLSKLTWTGTEWDHVQLVRGFPRSEENHATNGMDIDPTSNTMYVMSGGHTNKGAPGANFSGTPEYALSAAMLSIDLDDVEGRDHPVGDDRQR